MSKKSIFIAIVIAILVFVGVFFIVNMNKKPIESSSIPNSITLKEYEPGTNKVLKQRTIESKSEIREFSRIVEGIKPLSSEEMVDLAILYQYEVSYDDITIQIQPSEKNYCNYINTKENVSTLAKLPDGLLDYIEASLTID